MDVTFDEKHVRTQKAQFNVRLDRTLRLYITCLAVVLIAVGIACIVLQLSIGWLLLGLSALPYMVIAWWNGELKTLNTISSPTTINDVLDPVVLGQLKQSSTPKDIAQIIGRMYGGQFFSARFGLTANLLTEIASDQQSDRAAIFEEAITIMHDLNYESVTPGMLLAALVRQFPNYDKLLAHIHIDYDDILEGLKWQHQLSELVAHHAVKRRTGGIARDWSFGYTPLLARFGQNISQHSPGDLLNAEISSHQKIIDQIIDTFSKGSLQNVALIGPTGAGKTTIVEAFAEKLLDANSHISSQLKYRQVVMLDASTLLSAAPGRGEIEALLMRLFSESYAAKNIILCLDNAQLFFEDGIGSVDVSNTLLPILEAGRLRVILTMDEQRFLQISQRNPNIANALNRIIVTPTDEKGTLEVMRNQLIIKEFAHKVTYTYQSLVEAYRLGSRYVHDIAMPAQALKLLESAASYAEQGLVTINSVQQSIEQTMDIKVSVASEAEDRKKLLNLENLIHKRMINQARAVTVVSDALRRARAGVRNENRPIGTFLFLGPTGVGKTELAKALADVYFGGEKRIVRIDLNEYVRSEDVVRLIADGATDPTSLVAQVMKQPYSVVLLDEIEKAHPSVLTTLLQLLDEGILRDINNREISFRDTIVIATSNAGADRIREYIQRGYKIEQFEDQFVNELIQTNQFRPEFLNRFDEIVTFTPLTKRDLVQVVELMIAGVNKTLEQQKISVHLDQDAIELLVEKGYDPQLGARPMRRVIQKTIENTIAKLLLSGAVSAGSVVTITREQLANTHSNVEQANAIIDSSIKSE